MNITISEALAKAQKFEDEDNYEQAYECYKYAHEQNKTDTDILQNLAITAQTLHLNDEAIVYWNLFMSIKPEDPISYTQLIDLYFHESKYDYYLTRAKLKIIENRLPQAVDDYKKAISNTTEEEKIIDARILLARTYEFINKPMQAIDEYLKVLDYRHDETVYLSLANLYYTEDKSSAINVLERALKEYPESVPVKTSLCKVYLATGLYAEAENVALNPLDKIKAMLMQDKNKESFDLLNSLSANEKKSILYYSLMAEYYYNVGNDVKALEYIESYEKADSNSPLPAQMRALIYEKIGNEFEAHFNWGKYHVKRNELDLALNEFLSAHSCKMDDVNVIKDLINVYTAMDNEFAASEFCEKLIKHEKNDVATLKRLVRFYEAQGYEEKTVEYLDAIIELNPRDYETLLKLAVRTERIRKIGEAIDYYKKYLKHAPNSEEKARIQTKIDKLENGEEEENEGFLDKLLKLFSRN